MCYAPFAFAESTGADWRLADSRHSLCRCEDLPEVLILVPQCGPKTGPIFWDRNRSYLSEAPTLGVTFWGSIFGPKNGPGFVTSTFEPIWIGDHACRRMKHQHPAAMECCLTITEIEHWRHPH